MFPGRNNTIHFNPEFVSSMNLSRENLERAFAKPATHFNPLFLSALQQQLQQKEHLEQEKLRQDQKHRDLLLKSRNAPARIHLNPKFLTKTSRPAISDVSEHSTNGRQLVKSENVVIPVTDIRTNNLLENNTNSSSTNTRNIWMKEELNSYVFGTRSSQNLLDRSLIQSKYQMRMSSSMQSLPTTYSLSTSQGNSIHFNETNAAKIKSSSTSAPNFQNVPLINTFENMWKELHETPYTPSSTGILVPRKTNVYKIDHRKPEAIPKSKCMMPTGSSAKVDQTTAFLQCKRNTTNTKPKYALRRTESSIIQPFRKGLKTNEKGSRDIVIYVNGMRYTMDENKRRLIRSGLIESSSWNNKRISNNATTTSASFNRNSIIPRSGKSASYYNRRPRTYQIPNNLGLIYWKRASMPYYQYRHATIAKQRSLQTLMRGRNLVKSNITCPIYQRLGRCLAHERAKCNKIHNKLQVNICNKYLRGECRNPICLLSHVATYAKMPVCKFFLRGVCTRVGCLYLHKKVSKNAQLCPDFIRGYCAAAENCNKRHELVCITNGRIGKCSIKGCYRCKGYQTEKFLQMDIDAKNKYIASKENLTLINPCENVTVGEDMKSTKSPKPKKVRQSKIGKHQRPRRYFQYSDDENEAVYVSVCKSGNLPKEPNFIPLE